MITIRQSASDRKWRYYFEGMDEWSIPYNSFESAAKAAKDNGFIWEGWQH